MCASFFVLILMLAFLWAVTHKHVHTENANVHKIHAESAKVPEMQARVCRRLKHVHRRLIFCRDVASSHGNNVRLGFVLHGNASNACLSAGRYPSMPVPKVQRCNTSTRFPATAARASDILASFCAGIWRFRTESACASVFVLQEYPLNDAFL